MTIQLTLLFNPIIKHKQQESWIESFSNTVSQKGGALIKQQLLLGGIEGKSDTILW